MPAARSTGVGPSFDWPLPALGSGCPIPPWFISSFIPSFMFSGVIVAFSIQLSSAAGPEGYSQCRRAWILLHSQNNTQNPAKGCKRLQ
jgi:hypothetical protein